MWLDVCGPAPVPDVVQQHKGMIFFTMTLHSKCLKLLILSLPPVFCHSHLKG